MLIVEESKDFDQSAPSIPDVMLLQGSTDITKPFMF